VEPDPMPAKFRTVTLLAAAALGDKVGHPVLEALAATGEQVVLLNFQWPSVLTRSYLLSEAEPVATRARKGFKVWEGKVVLEVLDRGPVHRIRQIRHMTVLLVQLTRRQQRLHRLQDRRARSSIYYKRRKSHESCDSKI
jgi:hypothetical protein